jgi:glycosyltransferase involved in cell wall biosynthesis
VEQIPKVLSGYRQLTGRKIYWILVGSGEMEDEVEKNINLYLHEDEYTWYRKRFDNQDNIFALFKRADFYTMMHKVSVFDLSTLQAMSYGCIPLLSNVGGNKELCGFDNGILVDVENAKTDLSTYFDKNEWDDSALERKKCKNMEIVRERFNNKAFLNGYKEVLYE